ncbi:MAG: YraN family protein [Planctomycetota bacterium]
MFLRGFLFQPLPIGERGERYAARMLRRKRHRVLIAGGRNRYGEIDIVSIDERTPERRLVFTEVKTRRTLFAGSPAEAVTPEKQRRLIRTAQAFLRANDLEDHPLRFDVVAIHWPKGARRPASAEHYEAAFAAFGR